ncbi:hypothetical protein EON81_00810 [bacterium]|nr:MAG: hypothetical protein EON81_00810 [bacterium]
MSTSLQLALPIRAFLATLLIVPGVVAGGSLGPNDGNIIPNGDFSQGNVGFTSEIEYAKPAFNCLWEGRYTVAARFDRPLLHKLIAPEPFPAPSKPTGKENVFFANAGGTESVVVWASEVKCQPNTQYLITFNCISFSGHIEDGYPPHQVATMEWVPEFEIRANEQPSRPFLAGCGKYYGARMLWNSKASTEATIKIVRTKFPHGGGLIGISNIKMVPFTGVVKESQ